jgi:hypothetical protein
MSRSPAPASKRTAAAPAHGIRPAAVTNPTYQPRRDGPLWLSHHWPEHYDRCARVGRVHVCRRCLVLYPATLATMVVILAGRVELSVPLIAAMWLLPLPMVGEWVAEHADRLGYSPRRQALFAALAAPGLGIALAEHVRSPFAWVVVTPVLTATTICAASALAGTWRRRHEGQDWEERHAFDEAERSRALAQLLAVHESDLSHDDPRTDR